jgi:hypothetical protein
MFQKLGASLGQVIKVDMNYPNYTLSESCFPLLMPWSPRRRFASGGEVILWCQSGMRMFTSSVLSVVGSVTQTKNALTGR